MKKLQSVLVPFLLLMVLVCSIFGQNIKDGYYRKHIGSDVVRIFNEEMTGGGTGFHVEAESGEVYILTNKHICEMGKKSGKVVIEKDGRILERRIIEVFEAHDLCLIEKMPGESHGLEVAKKLKLGEDVLVLGHPGLRDLTMSHGEFIGPDLIYLQNMKIETAEECNGKFIDHPMAIFLLGHGICLESFETSAISSITYGGNSGSPVVNKYGNVVGVLFAGSPAQSTDSHMVPLKHIKDFLRKF